MNAVEDLIENIFAEDYALAALFAEKRQELNVQRYLNISLFEFCQSIYSLIYYNYIFLNEFLAQRPWL